MLLYITILPSLFILLYIIRSDKFPEPNHLIVKTFFLGVLLCFPAGIINTALISGDNYFIAGFTEEPLKFAVLYLYIKNKMDFNEPLDAIVYGTLISLGFATLENLEYVYILSDIYNTEPIVMAITRAITAIPLHASCGIIMGFYFGLYIFRNDTKCLMYAIAIPIFVHSFYNFLAGISFIFMTIHLVIVVIFVLNLHKKYKLSQQQKISEAEMKRK